MFGKRVEWHSFQQAGDLQTLCELPIPGELPLFAHVWVHAPERRSARGIEASGGVNETGQSRRRSQAEILTATGLTDWLILRFGGLVGKYHPKPLCGRQLWRDFGLSNYLI